MQDPHGRQHTRIFSVCFPLAWNDNKLSTLILRRLFCEEIDVGEEAPRNIASGLVPHYSLDEMKGRRVVVMCNLKVRPWGHSGGFPLVWSVVHWFRDFERFVKMLGAGCWKFPTRF